jgi:cellulose synthase/poly-beta-1,6-N-acetylglucosamine synthase-like glycosyltransferase
VAALTAAAFAVAAANLLLRALALLALRRHPAADGPAFASRRAPPGRRRKLPTITMLVPMHREPDIARPLLARLSRVDYPRALLDVALVVEADDTATLDALAAAPLPHWIRVVPVPAGEPRTKPRAMNYALNFARGSVVGVWDAEDAPAPDQLRMVARRLMVAPPEVACLQGKLDYYNAGRNWLSRCFAIEYATWFRLLLPGIERMGLTIPLGGTTLFFRREALERIGAWDAHNVTEDADLGVRLARAGYRTEVIDTTTLEEATAAALPWIKQRSRWLKGYVMTWAVHMRSPRRLWRELGAWRFLGVQWLFGGAVLNAFLLPFAWSPLVMAFGLPHPIAGWLPEGALPWAAAALFGMALANMAVAVAACRAPAHRPLRPWTCLLELYFPLATLAIWKGLVELTAKPFHWDKTDHGAYGGCEEDAVSNGPPGLDLLPRGIGAGGIGRFAGPE